MRTASKPSLQALSQAILQSNKVNLTVHHHARTCHGSAHLGSTSVCYASDKKSMPYSSLEASCGQPPRIWQCRQHRYFSSLIGKHGNSVFISRNSSASIVSPDTISHDNKNENNSFNSHAPDINENHSLHSNVHYIIHKIQVGTMKNDNLGKARSFLSIVSKWNNEKGALLAEALLERLYKERFVGKNIDAVVDTEVYNICLDAWNKSNANGDTIIEKAELLTKRMESRFFHGQKNGEPNENLARPDRVTYNCLLNAYSKSDADSSEKVDSILEKMNALADDAASIRYSNVDAAYESLIRPDEVTYNSAMNYYATRKNEHWSAQRAQDLLLQMSGLSQQQRRQEQFSDRSKAINVSATSFNIVLKAWSNSGGGIHGAQRAESVLQMMIRLFNKGHDNVQPNALSFSTVIDAYSKVAPGDFPASIEKAMELLDIMEGSPLPDDSNVNSCYNAVANIIAKSGLDNADDTIQQLMKRMKNMDATPDAFMLTSCIEAIVRAGNADSLKRGKELLLEIANDPFAQPTSVMFNTLLDAITKGGSDDSLEQAEDLMCMMKKIGGDSRPDTTTYNIMISALSRSTVKDSERKVVDYLRSMLRSYNNDGYTKAKPSIFAFNCCISMLARSKEDWADDVIYKTLMAMENQHKRGNTSVIPDTITYNSVIGKLAKANTKGNAKKVMNILSNMERMAESGNDAATPDIITYTSVLKAQEKVDPQRAASIASTYLERAISSDKQFAIDKAGFRTLLLALSRSGKIDDAKSAHKAWEWIENIYTDGKSILDSSSCNLVLVAYNKTKCAESANGVFSFLSGRMNRFKAGNEATILPTVVGFSAGLGVLSSANRMDDVFSLIDEMNELSNKGVPGIKPDKGCYTSILAPLARNKSADGALYAQKLLTFMKEDSESPPTTMEFNAAINACASTSGKPPNKRKALEAAFEIFQQARESRSVDAVTYGIMIKACMKLTNDDETRLKLIEPLFKLCAKNGLVGSMVLREIRHLKKILLSNNDLPREWRINANDE